MQLTTMQSLKAFSPATTSRSGRRSVVVTAQKAVTKKTQIVLTRDVPGLGKQGDLKAVPVGYFRNFLQPQSLATPATEGVLAQIQKQIEADERARLEEKAKAQAMATALGVIGKFVIKRKVGENDKIFGSVTAQDVAEAIQQQTGRDLEKRNITLPEIKTLGTYDATVKLHPEVIGSFKVVVQKDTSA